MGSLKLFGNDLQVDGNLIRIARLKAEKYDFVDDPKAAVESLRTLGRRIDIFTFFQKLPETAPKYGYQLEWDNLAALPLSSYDHWWTKQINGKTRNMVRRAEKLGMVVREVPFDDALVQGISAIYNESPTRQGKAFWHYGKGLDAVRAENGTFLDRSVFIGAFLGDSLIGFAKLVSDTDRTQAGLMQIVSMIQHRDKAPTNALIAQAVRSCADRGWSHLVYSNFSYGNKHSDSLSDFKEHNGFLKIDVPRYYVPLTLAGRAALRAGLHHRLVDRIPEPVLVHLRALRSAWNNRRVRTTNEGVPGPFAKESGS
jgi:hypothetical protein